MSKKQTTGMPKRSKRRSEEQEQFVSQGWLSRLLGNPTTRSEYEESLNRLISRTVMGVVIAVVILIAAALSYDYLIVPNQPVATVNSVSLTAGEFQERVKFEQAWVLQQLNARYSQMAQQAEMFGMDVNELLQNDTQFMQWNSEYQFVDTLGLRVIDDMIEDELIRQEIEARGIEVDDAVVENRVDEFFGYDPTEVAMIGVDITETAIPSLTPNPFVSPTPTNIPPPTLVPTDVPEATPELVETTPKSSETTPEAVEEVPTDLPTVVPSSTPSQDDVRNDYEETQDLFRTTIRETGNVGNSAIDAFFAREARRAALSEALFGQNPVLYVNARHILVDTEEEATEIIEALNAGTSFADLARARSTDEGSGARGGELNWSPTANYVAEFRQAVTDAPIGEVVGPVESEFGFHIIQVRAREEREVDENELQNIEARLFAEWLENLREENDPNISISDNWTGYLD